MAQANSWDTPENGINFIYNSYLSVNMIRIITIGKIKTPYVKQACEDLFNRIKRFSKIEIIKTKESTKKKEGEKILELTKDKKFIALDLTGKQQTSESFSKIIKNNIDLIFVIGNFNGLDKRVLDKAQSKLSLSSMTLTHEHAQLFLLEQIYRGFTIIKGLPYHK